MVDYADLDRVVREWFPVRTVAMDAALRRRRATDSWAALVLAETLVTCNDDIRSEVVPVLRS
jgi:hypothetical protein